MAGTKRNWSAAQINEPVSDPFAQLQVKAASGAWLGWTRGGNKIHALGFQIIAATTVRPIYPPSVKTTLMVVSTSAGSLSSLYGL